jgi:hypothetical protein
LVRDVFTARTPAALAGRLGPARAPLVPQVRAAVVPVSFGQQRLWFIAQLEGSAASYVDVARVRLSGELDRAALELALADVVGRHEVLRTVFPAEGGQPCQRVLPVEEARWGVPGEGFDLAAEVPVRVSLSPVGVLVLAVHHIAFDGWSAGCWPGMCRWPMRGGRRGGRRCRCSTPITRSGSGSCPGPWRTRAACCIAFIAAQGRPAVAVTSARLRPLLPKETSVVLLEDPPAPRTPKARWRER